MIQKKNMPPPAKLPPKPLPQSHGSLDAVDLAGADQDELIQKLRAYREALSHDPRNATLLTNLGLVADQLDDLDRARWAYRRAIRLDPTYAPAYYNLGLHYQKLGRNKEAILSLRNCLKYAGRGCDPAAVHQALSDLAESEAQAGLDAQAEPVSPAASFEPIVSKPIPSAIPIETAPAQSAKLAPTAAQPEPEPTQPVELTTTPAQVEHAPAQPPAIKPKPTSQAITGPLTELGLTPAEALMLLDPDGSDSQAMLRYTTMDLVNRGILQLDHAGNLSRGEKYNQEELKPHEKLLARIFERYEYGLDLTRYTNVIVARLDRQTNNYKLSYVRDLLLRKGYMTVEEGRLLGFLPIRKYVLTPDGVRLAHELKRRLQTAQIQIKRLMRSDPELARTFIQEAGLAMIMLDEYSVESISDYPRLLADLKMQSGKQKSASS